MFVGWGCYQRHIPDLLKEYLNPGQVAPALLSSLSPLELLAIGLVWPVLVAAPARFLTPLPSSSPAYQLSLTPVPRAFSEQAAPADLRLRVYSLYE